MCRNKIVAYEVKCKITGKKYIGNTQQFYKTRMQKHFDKARLLHKEGKRSDSYAKHFQHVLQNFKNISPELQRNSIESRILWQGNPISTVKTFATPHCTLCAKERLEILKLSKKNPESLINSCDEIYGACRHNPQFHRYVKADPSTDESGPRGRKGPYRKSYHRGGLNVQAMPYRSLTIVVAAEVGERA